MLGFSSTPSLPTIIPKALARFQQNCSSPLSVRFCPLRCLKWLGSFMWNLGNSKFSPLARSRRADRVCQQLHSVTASTGILDRIPISSEELL